MKYTGQNVNTLGNGPLNGPADPPSFAEYSENGLTYKSNNVNIIPRDEAGNIIIQPSSSLNEVLVIEPMVLSISTDSFLRVYDTAFQYYKFPVATSVTTNSTNFDQLNYNLNLDSALPDTFYARYKPSSNFAWGPTNTDSTFSNFEYSGLLCDEVVDGIPQVTTNGYTISKEVKNSGRNLRFRFKIAHSFSSTVDSSGGVYFSIIKQGPNYPLNRKWREPFASSRISAVDFNAMIRDIATTMRNICDDPAKLGGDYNTLSYEEPWITYYRYFKDSEIAADQSRLSGNQIEAINYVDSRDATKVPRTTKDTYNALRNELRTKLNTYNTAVNTVTNTWGVINNNTTQYVYIDEIIPNSEFEIGDVFSLGGLNGQPGHTLVAEQTYWVITDASKNVDVWNQEIA